MLPTLLVASTRLEISDFLTSDCLHVREKVFTVKSNNNVQVLITGMGIANMTLQLSRFLSGHKVERAINIGFCGSFDDAIQLGTILDIKSDTFAEMGVLNDDNQILSFDNFITDENLLANLNTCVKPTQYAAFSQFSFPRVNAVTVSSCTNNTHRANMMMQNFAAQVESMEGAAFFLTCNAYHIACAQFRTVSNHIPGRSPDRWDIENARKATCELASALCFHET